ncbi:hypothetical protein [Caldimonas taiwanensis]|uniref:hypothetical protein n=1 Tax=Caldimonas taiwanensis TaxID=307483 RepID=UPI0012F89554|nr:hypothetical protein [Caldimonas taiwanensis]
MRTQLWRLGGALMLVGCAHAPIDPWTGERVVIDPSQPPKGAQMMQLFLSQGDTPLRGSGCMSDEALDARLTLRDRLAQVLGDALDHPEHHRAVLKGTCTSDPVQTPDGRVIDAWACSLNMVQEDITEGFVANAFVRGHFTKERWRLVPGSLLCL